MMHFHTAFPDTTNFLPVLVWNGYSQEHHSMVSLHSNEEMVAYWKAHGFDEVVLVDARAFDDAGQQGDYVDSTLFGFEQRLAFSRAVLEGMERATTAAMNGRMSAFIIKQLKGAGVHAHGAKSHNLYPGDNFDRPTIAEGLSRRALTPEAWSLVRENFERAGGGPAGRTVVTESERPLAPIGELPVHEFDRDERAVPSSAMAETATR